MGQRVQLEIQATLFEAFIGEYLKDAFKDCYVIYDKHLNSACVRKGFTQIDVIAVTKKAVYVIEAKDWVGFIKGTYNDYNWTGLGRNPKGMNVFSPILQNLLHLRLLKANAIRHKFDMPPMYSLICVPDECTIKSSCKEILHFSELGQRIRNIETSLVKEYDQMSVVKTIRLSN